MKLNKWLYGATALAMLAACSDKDIAPGGNPEDNGISFKEGTSYIGISLQLPSELETRTVDDGNQGNDNFQDGLPIEYNVDNAALLLFIGATEDEAEFIGAYALTPDAAFDQPNKDNITVSFQQAAKLLSEPKFSAQMWGLAIVNYKTDHFSINQTETSNYGDLTVRTSVRRLISVSGTGESATETDVTNLEGTEDMPKDVVVRYIDEAKSITRKTETSAGMKFKELRGYITDCQFILPTSSTDPTMKGIFMTNAPLSDKKGTSEAPSGATIQTLAKLDKKFMNSMDDAIKNPAGCIFVERALAKITCSKFPTSVILKRAKVTQEDTGAVLSNEENVSLNVSVEWMLDNEEQSSYIIRNTSEITSTTWALSTKNWNNNVRYRFIGQTSMADHNYDGIGGSAGANHQWFRTYWCTDPFYDANKDFNDQANKKPNFVACNENSVLYSHENTFDVGHQQYANTTRVIFKVKYTNPDATEGNPYKLYAKRGLLKNFYLEEDAEKLFKRTILGSGKMHDLILSLVSDAAKQDAADKGEEVSVNYTPADIVLTCNKATASDVDAENDIRLDDWIVKKIEFANGFFTNHSKLDESKLSSDVLKTKFAEIAKLANAANHIVPFTDNTCYYSVYLQHFGKTYCPLKDEFVTATTTDTWKGESVNEVYPGLSEEKYLGRYGLVRNNWYDLEIDNILNLGNASVPNGNVFTSDDNKKDETFISARIHILSWAKRTQSVTL